MSKLLTELTENQLRELILSALLDHDVNKKLRSKAVLKRTINGVSLATLMSMSPIGASEEQDVFPTRVVEHTQIVQPPALNEPAVITSSAIVPVKKPILIEAESVILSGAVNFPSGQSKLSPALVDRLQHVLRHIPKNASVIVVGHTDKVGTPANNLQISKNRANAVAQFLHLNGVSVTYTSGKGDKQLIDNVNTPSLKNRRVDLIIQTNEPITIDLPGLEIKQTTRATAVGHKWKYSIHKDGKKCFKRVHKKRIPFHVANHVKHLRHKKSEHFVLNRSDLKTDHVEHHTGMVVEHLSLNDATVLTKIGEDSTRSLFWDGKGKLIEVNNNILPKQ